MSVPYIAKKAFASMQKAMGTSVTVRIPTSTYNEHGDLEQTFSDKTYTAVLEPVAEYISEVGGGGFHETGDFYLYLPYTATVNVENHIVVEDEHFLVTEVIRGYPGSDVYKQARIKRITTQ
jgi:hypothetical protein